MTHNYQPLSVQLLQQTLENTIDIDPTLSTYEQNLRCAVCYDFIKTALTIDTCSHTYCALCIRRSLYFIQRCPTCLVQCTSNNLHINRTVDLLIQQYAAFKQQLVKTLSRQLSHNVPKHTVIDVDAAPPATNGTHTAKQSNGIASLFAQQPSSHKRQKLSKVECPVCYTPVIQSQINAHLDSCLGVPQNVQRAERQLPSNVEPEQRTTAQLPVYNLLKDKQIRDMLKQVNLPVHGDRDTLIRRHREYLLQYNAEHDSDTPASSDEIARDIVKREQKQQSNISNRLGKQATLLDVFHNRPAAAAPVRHKQASTKKSSPPPYTDSDEIIVLDDKTNLRDVPPRTMEPQAGSAIIAEFGDNNVNTPAQSPAEPDSSTMAVDNGYTSSDDDAVHPTTQAEMFNHLIAQYRRKHRQKHLPSKQTSVAATATATTTAPAHQSTVNATPAPVAATTVVQPIIAAIKTESQCWRAIWHDKLQRVFYYNTMSHVGQFEQPAAYADTGQTT